MRENISFLSKLFKNLLLNNELNVYKIFSRVFHSAKPITNYKNIQLLTLLHEDKLVRITKKKKIQKPKFVGVFVGAANFATD